MVCDILCSQSIPNLRFPKLDLQQQFEYTNGVIRSSWLKDSPLHNGQQNKNGQIMVYKTPYRKLNFEQHEHQRICTIFVTFFSATIDGRNLMFGHKLHIDTPYGGKRFLTRQIPTSCLPKSEGIRWALAHSSSCWCSCCSKFSFLVHKNQQNQQTGSRNLMGPKTLPTI
jgi:hypothetical protein